ncbi:MAG: hypothetical protein MUE55_03965 [Thermoplasmata archaeon]|jgi:hypothetical protein|nr:hypothetical protein [Thermoplasmata archaeon]
MGRIGAYRKEDRVGLPKELQKELVDRAASRRGNCQELAKALGVPKSSVHYYRTGRLALPTSVLDRMLEEAGDDGLERRVREAARGLDRTWANYYSSGIMREMYRQKVRLPTLVDLQRDDELRRKAAAVVSYVMAEGSVWTKRNRFDEGIVNITFAEHETDLYNHFRGLCRDVFGYDIGPPQPPGNGAKAIRGFIYSRFVAEWFEQQGVPAGEKSSSCVRLPRWAVDSNDRMTWIGAVQPFCDGEGTFSSKQGAARRAFSMVQARHTDLDFEVLRHDLTWRGACRTLARGDIDHRMAFGVPVMGYCGAICRSELLDDIRDLLERLGFKTKLGIAHMYLKDDGFWSCNWIIRFSAFDSSRLVSDGLVTQERKVALGRR